VIKIYKLGNGTILSQEDIVPIYTNTKDTEVFIDSFNLCNTGENTRFKYWISGVDAEGNPEFDEINDVMAYLEDLPENTSIVIPIELYLPKNHSVRVFVESDMKVIANVFGNED